LNQSTGDGAVTIVLSEGIYAVGETMHLKPERRTFTKTARLTVRSEVLPDDPEWHTGRMPTLIHTMPLPSTWNGRPDPLGGAADGFMVDASHVTFRGLEILGYPRAHCGLASDAAPGRCNRQVPGLGRQGPDRGPTAAFRATVHVVPGGARAGSPGRRSAVGARGATQQPAARCVGGLRPAVAAVARSPSRTVYSSVMIPTVRVVLALKRAGHA
jgi:hypothetical protein